MSTASPISTGGGGVSLESRVVAYFMASILSGGSVRGLPAGTSLRLQRAGDGRPLDDIVVVAETSSGLSSLDFQVKRTVHIGGGELFQEVMTQCWATFNRSEFRLGYDRFGIITGTESRTAANAEEVLRWARNKADAEDFLSDIAKIANKKMQRFVQIVRSALDTANGGAVSDLHLWQFLRHLVLMPFDFDREDGSRDRLHAVERLAQVLAPVDVPRATDLWYALVDLADSQKATAGTTDRASIIEKLTGQFSFGPSNPVRDDLERLGENSKRAMLEISDTIAGIYLPRQKLLEKAEEKISGGTLLEIAGERGTGKSVLLRRLVESAAEKAPVLFLRYDRLPVNAPGWEGLANLWQIKASLSRIIAELGTAPSPCLYIDGLDRIESPSSWSLIRDLFDAIARSPAASRWSVVATVRSSAVSYRTVRPLDALPGFRRERIAVSDFGPEELETIAAAVPHIAPLLRSGGRASSLATRPFLLSLLAHRQGHPALETKGRVLTEIDLMEIVWTDGGPLWRKRQDLLLELGRVRLKSTTGDLRLSSPDYEALESLVNDEIIREDSVTRRIRFSHDILEDWVLSLVLEHLERPVSDIIREAGGASWLVDAVQIRAMQMLERDTTAGQWAKLLVELTASDLSPMWRRAVLVAPVRSTRSMELLTLVGSQLLAGEAALLRDLMVALRTVEVDPASDKLIDSMFPGETDSRKLELAHLFAIPRPRPWSAFFSWLLQQLHDLPANLFPPFLELLEVMNRAVGVPAWIARAVIPLVYHWLCRLERWDRQSWETHWKTTREAEKALGLDHEEERPFPDRLRRILLACSLHTPKYTRRYIRAVARERRHTAVSEILRLSNHLATNLPSDCADFVLNVLVEESDPSDSGFRSYYSRSYRFDKLGIKDQGEYFQPSHLRPPFLSLLRTSPVDGLRAITGICNVAMSVWREWYLQEFGHAALPVLVRLPWGEQEFWGDNNTYNWFRGTSVGPYPVISGLIALEVWMEERIKAGDDPVVLFRTVLADNTCIGSLSTCISICLAFPEQTLSIIGPLIAHPHLWYWDIERSVLDRPESNLNLFGSPGDVEHLRANAERNMLPHRRLCLRDLIANLIFNSDDGIRDSFQADLQRLSDGEPQWLDDGPRTTEDRQAYQMAVRRIVAVCDPVNWQVTETPEPNRLMIQYVPPEDLRPEVERIGQEHDELSRAYRLVLWAQKSLDTGSLDQNMTWEEAFKAAKAFDHEDLFSVPHGPENFAVSQQQAAVAGVAAVLARLSPNHSPENDAWARNVFHRVLEQPIDWSDKVYSAILTMFPLVYVAHGLVGLVTSNQADEDDRQRLLALSAYPLKAVCAVVHHSLRSIGQIDPQLAWQIFALGTRMTVVRWDILPYGPSPQMTDGQVAALMTALEEIRDDYDSGKPSTLQRVPSHWAQMAGADPASTNKQDWRLGDDAFRWHIAETVVLSMPLDLFMLDTGHRSAILQLVDDLVVWLIEYAHPPFEEDDHQRPYEWCSAFMRFCGELSSFMSADEAWQHLVEPFTKLGRDAGFTYINDFLQGLISRRINSEETATPDFLRLWSKITDWVLGHPSASTSWDHEHFGNEVERCLDALVFCAYGRCWFQQPLVSLPEFTPCLEKWVKSLGHNRRMFLSFCKFLSTAGWPLVHGVGLHWLAEVTKQHRLHRTFWTYLDNGDNLALLLDRLVNEQSAWLLEEPSRFTVVVSMADILVEHGISIAARVQQQLAKLART